MRVVRFNKRVILICIIYILKRGTRKIFFFPNPPLFILHLEAARGKTKTNSEQLSEINRLKIFERADVFKVQKLETPKLRKNAEFGFGKSVSFETRVFGKWYHPPGYDRTMGEKCTRVGGTLYPICTQFVPQHSKTQ
jgi:hypothetical protein